MATGDVKRKLTAIFSADVEGYSRLMEEDELATIETLTLHKEIMTKLIRKYRGRVVDSTGDNLLAEFASVVDGVQCAVEVQQVLSAKNETLPENRRMYFRIGINLGDVVEEGDLIYGDGVNVAARVESLAEGGGISISGTAYDQLGKKLPLGYEYLGEQTVKNIEKPVRVYRVLTEAEAAGKVIGEEKPRPKHLRWAVVGALAVLIIGAGVWAIWNFHFRPSIEPASVEKMAFPLPDRPSIAVLAFVNMSGDPEQEYFSDGLTEEIITTLSKVSDLFVIALESTFSYKGKPVKIRQVAEELGVRYVLEGSVRKAENRVRVTARLIDALTGRHLWADSYDRELKDTFAVQSAMTKEIITALEVKLTEGEQARVFARGTDNVEAWALGLKAWKLETKYSKENNAKAQELLERALELDPEYPFLWTALGKTHYYDGRLGWSKSPADSYKRAVECLKKALSINEEDPFAHATLGPMYLFQRKYDEAIAEGQRAISIAPNYADGYAMLAQTMRFAGRFGEALSLIEKAMRLSPNPRVFYPITLGYAYYELERYEEAIPIFEQIRERCRRGECPRFFGHLFLIPTYMGLGREEEARAEAEELLKVNPTFSVEWSRNASAYKDPAHLERHLNALRKAGIPEHPPLPLPDKPSIAVLPFVNMSGDPEQEYFSEGISEEIITALSKSSQLFVIARESTFSYKGKQVKVQQIARELGVRYILEGSVRKSEDRVRITAQLIDGIKGQHLWSERYDRDLRDIFALQDEITMKIVTALQVKLTEGEQARMWGKKAYNLDVYLKQMEALSLWRKGTKQSIIRVGQLGEEIVDMAPESAVGYRLLAWYYWWLARTGTSPRESSAKAFKLAQKALSLDESDADSHALLGSVYLAMKQYEKAITAGERSVELNPNGAMVHGLLGMTLSYADRPDEAIDYLKQGIRLNPFPAYWYFRQLGLCYMQKGQYEEALTEYKKALHRSPDALINHADLAIVYILLDRQEEARAAAKKVSEIDPKFSVERVLKGSPLKNQAFVKLIFEAIHKAGLK